MERAMTTASNQRASIADSIFVGMTKLFPNDPNHLPAADLKRWEFWGYEMIGCKGTIQTWSIAIL